MHPDASHLLICSVKKRGFNNEPLNDVTQRMVRYLLIQMHVEHHHQYLLKVGLTFIIAAE